MTETKEGGIFVKLPKAYIEFLASHGAVENHGDHEYKYLPFCFKTTDKEDIYERLTFSEFLEQAKDSIFVDLLLKGSAFFHNRPPESGHPPVDLNIPSPAMPVPDGWEIFLNPQPASAMPFPGDIGIVTIPVKVIFEYSDKIVDDVDDDNEPASFRSGLVMRIMEEVFVYDERNDVHLLASTTPSTRKALQELQREGKGMPIASEGDYNMGTGEQKIVVDRYPMGEDQPAQIDCRVTGCKFYREGGKCTNPAPAITLNPSNTYTCWSRSF